MKALWRQVLWQKIRYKGSIGGRWVVLLEGWLIKGYMVVVIVLLLLFFLLIELLEWTWSKSVIVEIYVEEEGREKKVQGLYNWNNL